MILSVFTAVFNDIAVQRLRYADIQREMLELFEDFSYISAYVEILSPQQLPVP